MITFPITLFAGNKLDVPYDFLSFVISYESLPYTFTMEMELDIASGETELPIVSCTGETDQTGLSISFSSINVSPATIVVKHIRPYNISSIEIVSSIGIGEGKARITGGIDLSEMTGLTDIRIFNHDYVIPDTYGNLTHLKLPNGTKALVVCQIHDNSLNSVNFNDWSTNSDEVGIRLEDNSMDQIGVDVTLLNLNLTGWESGYLDVSGNNAVPSAVGLGAIVSLTNKGWVVDYNAI